MARGECMTIVLMLTAYLSFCSLLVLTAQEGED